MASINDFKLLNAKCNLYFKQLQQEIGREIPTKKETDPARFGFYLYILENISGEKEFSTHLDCITDTDFRQTVYGEHVNDEGLDAIYINDDDKTINLFNFKYRESFKPGSQHSLNDVFISTKFVNALMTENTERLQGILKEKADEILEHLYSSEIWKLKLFIVSNEDSDLDIDLEALQQLQDLYDLEIIPISLTAITNFMSLRPQSIDAKLVLEKDAMLSYKESVHASNTSYILKLSIPELLRITCNEKSLRNNYSLEDYSVLHTKQINYGVLFDNVRGYLGETKYNKNIFKTLQNEPNRFFMFNNGLTITVKDLESEEINVKKKMKLSLEDIQVVNGGQTLRTLHKFNNENSTNMSDHLAESEILVRVFKTGTNPKLTSQIAEYTNSQNSISPVDLKSIAYEQIQIEQYFANHQVIYARKSGDIGSSNKEYIHKISMEKFAQILFSTYGNPDRASNQKKKLFDKYYDNIFGPSFDLDKSMTTLTTYYDIKSEYESSSYESSDQKIFYILYLKNKLPNEDTITLIDKLEISLTQFKPGSSSDARKLIQRAFKEYIDKEFNMV